ncbi:MAG: hypothetical protein WBA46_11100, partial [Thermomicrobiales bacterium]
NPQGSLTTIAQMTSGGRVAEVNVSMLYYDPANLGAPPRYIPREEMARNWVYTWDEASQTWMIAQVGLDVNRG